MASQSIYIPKKTFIPLTIECILYGMIGVILGTISNNLVVYLSNKLNIRYLFLQNVIQLTLCSIILSAVHVQLNYFGWSWQNITPGLFFVSFFFGVQFKMITNIQNSYILEDTVHYTLDKLLESKRISSLQDSLIKDTL